MRGRVHPKQVDFACYNSRDSIAVSSNEKVHLVCLGSVLLIFSEGFFTNFPRIYERPQSKVAGRIHEMQSRWRRERYIAILRCRVIWCDKSSEYDGGVQTDQQHGQHRKLGAPYHFHLPDTYARVIPKQQKVRKESAANQEQARKHDRADHQVQISRQYRLQ